MPVSSRRRDVSPGPSIATDQARQQQPGLQHVRLSQLCERSLTIGSVATDHLMYVGRFAVSYDTDVPPATRLRAP